MRKNLFTSLLLVVLVSACGDNPAAPVDGRAADAQAADETYITWEELLVDDPGLSKIPIRGAGRMRAADLNQDGHVDVLSAHRDSSHVRVAWGTGLAFDWARHSLAEGDLAPGAEDVLVADFSGDGWLDAAVACEGHILYLENPAQSSPGFVWAKTVLEASRQDGAWIRLSSGDLDGDGRPELVATADDGNAVAIFRSGEAPLDGAAWTREAVHVSGVVNAQAADLDGDGDPDLLASPAEGPPTILRNDEGVWTQVAFTTDGDRSNARVVEFFDFSGDGRLDFAAPLGDGRIAWFEQPASADGSWKMHEIGSFGPDVIGGLAVGDVDGDDRPDLIAGSVSAAASKADEPGHDVDDPSGRVAWFRNAGEGDAGEGDAGEGGWSRHDVFRRQRGAFVGLAAADVDGDGAADLLATRGGSGGLDGVFVLQQVRESVPMRRLVAVRRPDSRSLPVPTAQQ